MVNSNATNTNAVGDGGPSRPYHSIRDASWSLAINSVTGVLVAMLVLVVLDTSADFKAQQWWTGSLLGRLLDLGSAVAPWVLPMYVTTLLAALAVLILPDWQGRADAAPELEDELAPVRRAIGRAAGMVGPVFVVWAFAVLAAAFIPGVAVGEQSAGVLLTLPIVMVLTVLVSRAALGTLEQRLADVAASLSRVGRWHSQLTRLSYPDVWLAKRPVVTVTMIVLFTDVVGAAMLLLQHVHPAAVLILAVATVVAHALVVCVWAYRYREPDRLPRRTAAVFALVVLGLIASAYASGPWPVAAVGLAMLAVPALLYLPRWGGRQLLASTGMRSVEARLAGLKRRHEQLADALRHPADATPQQRAWRWFRRT